MFKIVIPMKEIHIYPFFRACPPRAEKLDAKRQFYAENGKYDRDLLVTPGGWLVDGYATYLAMLENGEELATAGVYEDLCPVLTAVDMNGERDLYGVSERVIRRIGPGARMLVFANGRARKLSAVQLDVLSYKPAWPAAAIVLNRGRARP